MGFILFKIENFNVFFTIKEQKYDYIEIFVSQTNLLIFEFIFK